MLRKNKRRYLSHAQPKQPMRYCGLIWVYDPIFWVPSTMIQIFEIVPLNLPAQLNTNSLFSLSLSSAPSKHWPTFSFYTQFCFCTSRVCFLLFLPFSNSRHLKSINESGMPKPVYNTTPQPPSHLLTPTPDCLSVLLVGDLVNLPGSPVSFIVALQSQRWTPSHSCYDWQGDTRSVVL